MTGDAGTAIIVGAGQGGATAATVLRENGWRGPIHLLGDEPGVPYQRPPLSKGFLLGTETAESLALTSTTALVRAEVDFRADAHVAAIDRDRRVVCLAGGEELPYDVLVLATGSRPRRLGVPGEGLLGVHHLRTMDDARDLQNDIGRASRVAIVGAGFLGLEVATVCADRAETTVLEFLPRILGRAVSDPTAAALAADHEQRGVQIRYSTAVAGFEGQDGRVTHAVLADGSRLAVDMALVAVGAVPAQELAEAAGLEVDGGIVVNERLVTSDPAIRAIGDCARYPSEHLGSSARVESVQNATDQARYVAADLVGSAQEPYRALPWFWSHQAGRKLQIAGLARPDDEVVVVDGGTVGMVVHRYRDGILSAVETIDNPRAHMLARRSLVSTVAASPSS